ncbi:uncharacterized protein CTRU02_205338 [Colletotrichum truncatum]|uniref:Uncharacterized protein n=1 Tax=Colletotrichum truncatum TaxID=5467 RepID=A0ACC3Z3Q4_COLTU|nr:uncharacterized protein CTRU02_04395 [Colletotrichum truncatum]KAF6795585.1 hypothetical protein CTRU02_04395 [Colletotrichum truncatum]
MFERGRRSPNGHGGPGDTLTLGVERTLGSFLLLQLLLFFLSAYLIAQLSCSFPLCFDARAFCCLPRGAA